MSLKKAINFAFFFYLSVYQAPGFYIPGTLTKILQTYYFKLNLKKFLNCNFKIWLISTFLNVYNIDRYIVNFTNLGGNMKNLDYVLNEKDFTLKMFDISNKNNFFEISIVENFNNFSETCRYRMIASDNLKDSNFHAYFGCVIDANLNGVKSHEEFWSIGFLGSFLNFLKPFIKSSKSTFKSKEYEGHTLFVEAKEKNLFKEPTFDFHIIEETFENLTKEDLTLLYDKLLRLIGYIGNRSLVKENIVRINFEMSLMCDSDRTLLIGNKIRLGNSSTIYYDSFATKGTTIAFSYLYYGKVCYGCGIIENIYDETFEIADARFNQNRYFIEADKILSMHVIKNSYVNNIDDIDDIIEYLNTVCIEERPSIQRDFMSDSKEHTKYLKMKYLKSFIFLCKEKNLLVSKDGKLTDTYYDLEDTIGNKVIPMLQKHYTKNGLYY